MARTLSLEALERKIERAQEQVSKTKKQYDAAISVLSDLLDKRDALKRDELVKAIVKSEKTFEEVIAFLNCDTTVKMAEEESANGKRSRKTKRTD